MSNARCAQPPPLIYEIKNYHAPDPRSRQQYFLVNTGTLETHPNPYGTKENTHPHSKHPSASASSQDRYSLLYEQGKQTRDKLNRKRSESFQREQLEMEAYFKPELCLRSRQMVEGAQDSQSPRSFGGDGVRSSREERAHDRLHKLSSKK